jgi:hypothetical protein
MTPYGEIAVAFASALAEGDFARAQGLLAPELRTQLSPAVLSEELHAMYDGYAGGEPTGIHYDEQFFMSDWPAKEPHDVGWTYVSIVGEAFVGAVTVIVAEVNDTLLTLIRAVEWGRP